MAPIETNFGVPTGYMTCTVTDPQGLAPQTIIRKADQWRVNLKWELDGMLVGMLSGDWNVTIYLESMGPQQEVAVFEHPIPFAAGIVAGNPFTLHYDKWWTLGPNTEHNVPTQPGVYKVVVVLTCKTPLGTPGPFAGFVEGPMIQFYVAP